MRKLLYFLLLIAIARQGSAQRQEFFGHNGQPHAHDGHSVTLSWVQGSGSVAWNNVYRGTVTGGPYTQIFSAGAPITTYADTGCLGTCFYVVTAANSSGESGYSNEVSAFVP